MEPGTSHSLIERAVELDSVEAIGLVAEAVRLTPEDHRARVLAARILGRKKRFDAAVAAYLVAAKLVMTRGYPLAAIAFAKEALILAPKRPEVLAFLEMIHARIAGQPSGKRVEVPPPVAPRPTDPNSPDAITALKDEALLLEKLEEVASKPVTLNVKPEASGVPMFSEITVAGFLPLVEALELKQLGPGEALVDQGEVGNALYLVVSGELGVTRSGVLLATLGPGALVGEMALITEQPRSASVVARGLVEVMCIERAHVEAVAREHPMITQELVDFARRRLLRNLLVTSPLFATLDADERLRVLRGFTSRVVPEGTKIIERGTAPTGLFVIATGEVKVTTADAEGDDVELATLGDGEVLGEIGLIEGGLTTATAVSTRKTVLLHLPRESFAAFVARPQIAAYLSALSCERQQSNEKAVASEVIDAEDLVVI